MCESELVKWLANKPLIDSAHLIATTRINQLLANKPKKKPLLLTSVGRITDQKVRLFQQKMENGESALENLLNQLGDAGVFILLGSGDRVLEGFLTQVAAKRSNFIFLKGYSESLSENLYSSGDLFLMPSSFEPCGISQMLSMRAGQPCLAHSVGGLSDTISNDENGFTFNGNNAFDQATNMLNCFENVIHKKRNNAKEWKTISTNALNCRFLWRDVAQDYIDFLYCD
jgi:starch synthase